MKWDDNRVLGHGFVIIDAPVPKWDSCFSQIVLALSTQYSCASHYTLALLASDGRFSVQGNLDFPEAERLTLDVQQ
jgi:hypothetical protein